MTGHIREKVAVGVFLAVIVGVFAYAGHKAVVTSQLEERLIAQNSTSLAASVPLSTLSDRVVITLTSTGATHAFLKRDAVDKGSFTSPAGFTQRNLCVTNASLPHMTVCFRPDADDSRDEVVFEYGTFMQQPVTTGPYTAAIFSGNNKIAEQAVDNHFFYQRWRWIPQGYRPRYRTIASVEEAKLLPPYRVGMDPAAGAAQNPTTAEAACVYTKPFDAACVTKYMGGTGERNDIGPVTGIQGKYILNQTDAWWKIVLAQAEAGSSIPWNIRDEGGTPINFYRTGEGIVERQKLNSHSNNVRNVDTYLPRPGYNSDPALSHGWNIDQAHQPALFYLPWILTGDPYYLEGMQFANSNNTLYTAWDRRATNVADLMEDQVRGVAWNLRTLFQLAASTPENVPSWLLPRSYYLRQSQENTTKMDYKFVNADNPLSKNLQAMSLAFWQNDFMTYIVGMGVWMGRSEWRPAFDFLYRHSEARLNGTSGWNRMCPTIYGLPNQSTDIPKYTSWAATWDIHVAENEPTMRSDGLCIVDAYSSYLLGSMAIADHVGITSAAGLHRWYGDMIRQTLPKYGGYTLGAKWSVAPRYVLTGTTPSLPDVIDPTPTPTPPPPTPTVDTTPPTPPANLSVATIDSVVSLAWTASTDNVGVIGYKIFRNSNTTPLVTVTNTVFSDTTVSPDTEYTYRITAIDAAGNESTPSSPVVVRTLPPKDITAPVIGGVSVTDVNQSGAVVTWTTNESATTEIVFGTTQNFSERRSVDGTRLSHRITLSGLAAGTQYYYRVEAVDAAGNRGFSGQGTFTTAPASTPEPTPTPTNSNIEVVSVSGNFSAQAQNCTTLVVGGSCEVVVAFNPTFAGTHSGEIVFRDTTSGSGRRVMLSGTAVAPQVSAPVPQPEPESEPDPSPTPQPSTSPTASDRVIGTDNNDLLVAGDGVTYVDGRGGRDTVHITALPKVPAHHWKIRRNSQGQWTVVESHASGYTIVIENIEEVMFADGTKQLVGDGVSTNVVTIGDTLIGTDGNDSLVVPDGIKNVDGRGGYDIANIVAVTAGKYPDWWRITQNPDGSWKAVESHGSGYTIQLKNIEEVRIGTFKKILTSTSDATEQSFIGRLFSRIASFFGGVAQESQFAAVSLFASPQTVTFPSTEVGKSSSVTITLKLDDTEVSVSYQTFDRNLRPGSRHPDVRRLQGYLVTRSYLISSQVTGRFDKTTEEAIKKYQCDKNIVCGGGRFTTGWGTLDTKTREVINADLARQ